VTEKDSVNGRLADFLFEAGMLRRIPRSGFHYLGSRRESVAEHSLRVCFAAWVLARLVPEADEGRLLELALFHDLPEARVGDLNSVSKQYVKAEEERAVAEAAAGLPFGEEIEALAREWREGASLEARLARDADHLDMLLSLKEELEAGIGLAAEWIEAVKERIESEPGRALAEAILHTRSDHWWLAGLLKLGGGQEKGKG
jgi:putative hydrolase of HD superfamily